MCVYQRTLEREIKGCQHLILWTDGDREGENIADEIVQVCTGGQLYLCCDGVLYTHTCMYRCVSLLKENTRYREMASKLVQTQLWSSPIPILHSTFLMHFYSSLEGATKQKFCQTARLEVCYCLDSFIAEVKIFRFWPKTMDYSPWFDFGSPKNVLRKTCQLNVYEKRNLMTLVSAA